MSKRSEICLAEKYPSDHNCQHGIGSAKPAGKMLQYIGQYKLLKQQEESVINTPEHEVPACSMPESGQCPYDEDISDMSERRNTVSTEWNVDIIPDQLPREICQRLQNSDTLVEI